MKLYLARHGQAARSASEAPSSLTAQGKTQTQLVAQELRKRNLGIQQIWHSPKTRASQTAEIYQSTLKINPAHFISKETLSIDGDIDALYQEILNTKVKNLLLVSHQPLLEELSSLLVAGSDHLPHIAFPTSGIVAFKYDARWKWLWSLKPSELK